MPESKPPKDALTTDSEAEFSHWQLPDITKDSSLEPSNFFGHFAEAHTPSPVTGAEKSMAHRRWRKLKRFVLQLSKKDLNRVSKTVINKD